MLNIINEKIIIKFEKIIIIYIIEKNEEDRNKLKIKL